MSRALGSLVDRNRRFLALARWRGLHAVLWPLLFGALTTTNALNEVAGRGGWGRGFETAAPFIWEYSSLVGCLAGAAFVLWVFGCWPAERAWQRLLHFPIAIVGFNLLHVGLMVGLRMAIYGALGRTYAYGPLSERLPIEFRKDFPIVLLIVGCWWIVGLLRDLAVRLDGPKYARSPLTDQDGDRIMHRLALAVAEQAIHRDPNLTLQRLSKAIGMPMNHVSQTLNVRAGGFHDWLARTRVEDLQRLLRTPGETTGLLDAAYAVGFNSKSTFYEAFRKATGQTPAAWRAGLRESAD